MSSKLIASHQEKAEVYIGEGICREKTKEVFSKISLPNGIIPLNDVIELGYNESTGFVWLRRKKKMDHRFPAIGRNVAYDTEVTGFIEDRRMHKVTGVKTKELLMWLTVSEVYINDPSSSKITFGTPSGLYRTFPVSAFLEENDK